MRLHQTKKLRENPVHCCWNWFSTIESSTEFLKNLKIELPWDPTSPLQHKYLKKKTTNLKRRAPNVHSSFFTIAKIWRQPKFPLTDEWIRKIKEDMEYIHTHTYANNGILSHKERTKFCISNGIDGLGRYYTKWNNSDR